MAFTNKLIDLIGILMTLMVLTFPSTAANIDCNGKSFHCVNSTHFMICVDLGSGVSSTIDNFVLQCPPPTVCQETNKFECDFPVVISTTEALTAASTVTSDSEIETVTKPYDLTTTATTVPYEQYLDTPTTTTLSEDVLITHQTTVTESTIQLVTDVTQNNEVIIPQLKMNETIPIDVVQNDLITTSSPNSISSNTTGATLDAFRNVNVTISETKFNSNVTEEILSTDVAANDLRTTSTLRNNSASDLDVFSVKTKVNIVTHESITNSTLNLNIQGATENATTEKTLYTSNNTDLPSDTTETSPNLDGIQNDVTNPLLLNISANTTRIINNTTENTNVIISRSEINLTIIETDPSAPEDIVTTVLSNSGSNITNLVKDSIKNDILATIAQNLNETIPSETNIIQYKHTLIPVTDTTTESIIYHVTLSTTENNTTEFIFTNSSATNILLDGTEHVPNTFNQTTSKVEVAQPESTTDNMSDYVKDLIAKETIAVIIPDVTIQSITEIAQTESTLSSNLNSNGPDTFTESIFNEVTKLTFNDTYLQSAALPIHTTDMTTESILDKVSETVQHVSSKVEVKSATTTILPDQATVSTTDPGSIVSESNFDSTLQTTPMFQNDTVQNRHAIISHSSSSVLPNYVAETVTEVTKLTEINPSVPANKTIISANVLQKDHTTSLSYLIADTTDMTVKVAESAINYTSNENTSSLYITQNDYTTPLPSISAYTTNSTGNESDVSNTNSDFNRITQNETNIAPTDQVLLLNLSGSTVLAEKTVTETESILIEGIQTPSKKQNNRTTPLSQFTIENPTELIPGLTENDNLLGLETNVSEIIISVNSVKHNTMSLPVDSNTVTDTTESVNLLASERNVTLNETLPSLDNIATESILSKVVETTPSLSFNLVQDYLTSFTSNTTLPDKLDIVTELPVTDVTEDINVVTAEYNLTLSAHYLRNPSNSSNSSQTINEKKVESKSIVPNDIQKLYAQNITDLLMKTAPNHTDNALILSVNEINKDNNTKEVSRTPSSTEPITESSNGSSTTLLVNNNNKNKTDFAITSTMKPSEIFYRKNMNNSSQAETINNKSNAINNENILTTSLPNHLAQSTFSQNSETSTQHTEIRTDSYVESKISESDKPANVLIATQSTPSSLSVDNIQSEVKSDPTINPRTTTSAFVLTNTGKHTSVDTVEKETSNITEYVTSTFQTEPLIVKTTVVEDTPPNDTGLLGTASITNPIATKSVRTSVTESYSTTNYIANVNAEHSSSTVNIDVKSTKQTNSMLLFNSSSELLLNGGQPKTAKSTPTQKNVNLTPNDLFDLPSALEQDNLAVSVQQELYKKPTNTNVNQSTSPNEISTNKDIAIQNTNPLKDILATIVNMSTVVRKDLSQEINNTEIPTHTLGITSQNKQDAVLEKSNQMGGQNIPSQNKDTITDRQTTLLDILLSTPHQLLLTTQSTPPQENYTAQYATVSTLTKDNLHAQPTFNYDFTTTFPVKINTAIQIDVIDKPNLESNLSKGSRLEERLDLKRGKENETISSLTLNVNKSSQTMEENPQISNNSLISIASSVNLDQDNVTSKQYTPDNLTSRPSTETGQVKVVTNPHIGEDQITSKKHITDNLTIRPSTEAWQAKVVTEPNMDKAVVTSKQYIADNLTIRPSTEAWQVKVVTNPYVGADQLTSIKYIADNLSISPSTEAWRAKVVTEPNMDRAVVTSKQYIAVNPTIRPSTEASQIKVVTEPSIGKVTSTQYSADTSTLGPSTESLQAIVVIKPDIHQNKVISTHNSGDITKIEPTETSGKLSAISDTIKSVSKPNEDKTILKRVISTSEDARLMIDLKLTTDAFKESLIKVTNGVGIEQIANKSNSDNLQSNHESILKTEFINNPKPVITQTTDQVITKTSDSKLDKGIIMVQSVKTSNGWLIKNNSPTQITGTNVGISPPLRIKGDREPEEIETVEQSEVNEEQAEYEESMKEEHDEALENKKEELNKMSPKILKMSPVNEYANFNKRDRLDSTIEMTTQKVEEHSTFSNSHRKLIANIEVQPATVKSTQNFDPTEAAKNVTANVKNSTVSNTLPKSFANTHTASTPVFVPAKRNFVCKINSRGKFPDKNDCRKFYICSGKLEPIEGLCPNNTVFSELRKQCTKNVSHCIRNNQFQCVREGRFSDYFNDNIYYICLKNNLSTFTRFKLQCLSGYHLNKTSVRCALNTEWSRSTSQQSISDASINSERVPSSRSEKLVVESSNKFECNKEGKFPDPNNCRKYYVCSKKNGKSRYRLKRKKCDSDELFHKDKMKCVDADSYDCN